MFWLVTPSTNTLMSRWSSRASVKNLACAAVGSAISLSPSLLIGGHYRYIYTHQLTTEILLLYANKIYRTGALLGA